MLGVRRLLGGTSTPPPSESQASSVASSPTKSTRSSSPIKSRPSVDIPLPAPAPLNFNKSVGMGGMESFRGLPPGKRPNWPPRSPSPNNRSSVNGPNGTSYTLPISPPPTSPGTTVKAGLFRRPESRDASSISSSATSGTRPRSLPRRALTSVPSPPEDCEEDGGSISDGRLLRNDSLESTRRRKRKSSAPELPPSFAKSLKGTVPAPTNGVARLAQSVSITPNASPTRNAFMYDSPSALSSPARSAASAPRASVSSPSEGRTGPEPYTPEWRLKHSSTLLDTSDDMLLSLLASQAVVDARDFQMLSMDEVEDLKREHALLSTRLSALRGKLRTETKIRNAAESLAKLHATHKRMSRATSEQYDQAVRKVEQVEREIGKVAERVAEVGRKLGEHRAGVLSWSLTALEKKVGLSPAVEGDEEVDEVASAIDGSSTVFSDPRSPASAVGGARSAGTSRAGTPKFGPTKFTGPHLFAGSEGAVIPPVPKTPTAQKVAALEQQVRDSQKEMEALRSEGKGLRERLERAIRDKKERESELAVVKQDMREMEKDLERLEGEEMRSSTLRAEMVELRRENEEWEGRVRELELEAELDRGRTSASGQDEEERLREREAWAARVEVKDRKIGELENIQRGVERLAREHTGSDDNALADLEQHLEASYALSQEKEQWAEERHRLKAEVETLRERLAREVEDARKQVDNLRHELTSQIQASSRPGSTEKRVSQPYGTADDAQRANARLIAALSELWNLLPSAEARSQSGLGRSRSRTPTSVTSPTSAVRPGGVSPTGGAPGGGNSSLSDMDVRTLKQLYGDAAKGRSSPTSGTTAEGFTVDTFVQRCKALIVDDKALMERLIRFAQAHDLLKANAERSQRLAQEGRVGMETYQKQVRAMEERLQGTTQREAGLLAEISDLQRQIEDVRNAKRVLEEQAAIQAETCHSLSEANKVLSARALALAAEAADAPQAARSKVEAQVSELKRSLQESQDEVDAIKRAEVSQRAQLLDELNAAQTENQTLRDQLRARSGMK
ncbi:hypothetical protein DACRYDRAFT_113194 [Dacryopinax primogenitus]|uniref:Up-regulated during septation protein 1 domain-containing protein n=1 Tax=Dacryopinax primogenitus (strain DJM 731) TaxID=1858805 RepID=M5GCY4_DACPD|nr:uncharacterized protein DACRYDRAFT_113194 [Dacryopinax primogenitus]EJU06500.1 hypothetical protein DACRYDRAFT_113194 [Dacryopinax primogenitus]